jgi:hypothetical protein
VFTTCPVVADFCVEHFEHQALSTTPLKPAHWFRYIDNNFVAWSHGRDELEKFQKHFSSIHPNIRFKMKMEEDNSLSSLDLLVKRKPDSLLRHVVYRKQKTYTFVSAYQLSPSPITEMCCSFYTRLTGQGRL